MVLLPSLMPLDLHVLSLSLAFILSQDQTLRCCLSHFYFLQNIKRQILFVFAFCSSVVIRTTPALDRLSYISKRPLSSIVFLYTLSGLELTESYFYLETHSSERFHKPFSLVLPCLLQIFQCSNSWLSEPTKKRLTTWWPKCFAKLRRIFELCKSF